VLDDRGHGDADRRVVVDVVDEVVDELRDDLDDRLGRGRLR
jgi:hypothetical protein